MFTFGRNLGMKLTRPSIQSRLLNGLAKNIQKKIEFILGKPDQDQANQRRALMPLKTPKRCKDCLVKTTGRGCLVMWGVPGAARLENPHQNPVGKNICCLALLDSTDSK